MNKDKKPMVTSRKVRGKPLNEKSEKFKKEKQAYWRGYKNAKG